MSQTSVPFDKFFINFWEYCVVSVSSEGGRNIKEFRGSPEEKKAIEKYCELKKKMKNDPNLYSDFAKTFYGTDERFSTPLTSISKELLLAMKEGLIDKCLVISSFCWENKPEDRKIDEADNGRKKQKVAKTFGQFPFSSFELTEVRKNNEGKFVPYRWERINALCPDFDIFIDDSQTQIKTVLGNFPDRIYILPDYLCNKKTIADNIYHVKTT